MRAFCYTLLGLLLTLPILAGPLETDRPDVTESAATVEAGRYQIETNLFNYTKDGKEESYDYTNFNIKKGFGDFDIQFLIGTMIDRKDKNIAPYDLGLRVKQRLVNNESFKLAVMPYVISPEANRDCEYGFSLPADMSLNDSMSFGFMPQLSYFDSTYSYLQTLVLGIDLTEKFGAFFETVASRSSDQSEEYYLNYGVTYLLDSWTQLDLAANHGLNSTADDLQIFTGLSLKF